MFDTGDLDTNSIYPSDFDILRLECMSVGDKINAENGNWTVFRYKSDYFLILDTDKKKSSHEFKSLKELIVFLRKN